MNKLTSINNQHGKTYLLIKHKISSRMWKIHFSFMSMNNKFSIECIQLFLSKSLHSILEREMFWLQPSQLESITNGRLTQNPRGGGGGGKLSKQEV